MQLHGDVPLPMSTLEEAELQLSELEMLASMFPHAGEMTILDPGPPAELARWVQHRDEPPPRGYVGFSVRHPTIAWTLCAISLIITPLNPPRYTSEPTPRWDAPSRGGSTASCRRSCGSTPRARCACWRRWTGSPITPPRSTPPPQRQLRCRADRVPGPGLPSHACGSTATTSTTRTSDGTWCPGRGTWTSRVSSCRESRGSCARRAQRRPATSTGLGSVACSGRRSAYGTARTSPRLPPRARESRRRSLASSRRSERRRSTCTARTWTWDSCAASWRDTAAGKPSR
ncbi:RWD domain-containing protein 2B isoform X2 [Lethenteron reissneri]|uniref:RWD domain-containing protein 2B isoform X2 n=1 Tax=Lethenteron reissneri TaxID=7753 RepID=UPI002AB676DE|nr:RWD domain-containing protein 2B isoform X2 [Lethenteron reissneri]